jgi:hypothetical protein
MISKVFLFLKFLVSWDKFKKFKYVPLVEVEYTPQLVRDWGQKDLKHNDVECCRNLSLGLATKAKAYKVAS